MFSKHIINLGDSIAANLAMGTCSFITHSSQLYTALKMLEKVILQNVYHEKLLSYRDYNFSKVGEVHIIAKLKSHTSSLFPGYRTGVDSSMELRMCTDG